MTFISIILYYLVPVVVIGYFWLKYHFTYWKKLGVSSTSPTTIFGDLSDVGRKYHISEKSQILYNKFKAEGNGRFGGLFTMTKPNLMLIDLDLIKNVLVKDFNYFTDRDFYFNEKDDPLSVSSLTLEGERWRRVRTLLTPIFTSGKLKNMFYIINDKSKELVKLGNKSVETQTPLEAKHLAKTFTVLSIGSCAFGIDLQTSTKQFDQIFNNFTVGGKSRFIFILRAFLLNYPSFARLIKLRFFEKNLGDFVLEMVSSSVKYRTETGTRRGDLLDLLMDIRKESEAKGFDDFTFMRLAAEALLFFIGGFDTSAATISWALYELANNQEYQDRLRAEIKQTKADNGGELTYEAIHSMDYLNQIFMETLRLYPPFPLHFRKAVKDYKIPDTNVVIEKGTSVWIPAYAIQRDESHYPNPSKFNPENFTKENIKQRDSLTYLSFGDGPRNCIGMRFAQLQVKLGIATIIDNFKISLNEKTQLPIKFDLDQPVTAAANGGLWINFEKM